MKINTYKLLMEQINHGIILGYNRAHKHTNSPTPDDIKQAIQDAIQECILEYFTFGATNND